MVTCEGPCKEEKRFRIAERECCQRAYLRLWKRDPAGTESALRSIASMAGQAQADKLRAEVEANRG